MKFMLKLAATTALVAVIASPAMAQEVRVNDNYFRLSGGALVLEDVDGNVGATPTELTFDTGWVASGAIGHQLSPQFAIEAELTYLTADFDKATVGGVSASIDGDVSSFLAMANANFHPFAGGGFDPYIGAGAGVAFSDLSVDSIGGVATNIDESGEDLALQGNAGFDFHLGGGSKFGAQYRYIWTDTGSNTSDELAGHAFTVNFTAAF